MNSCFQLVGFKVYPWNLACGCVGACLCMKSVVWMATHFKSVKLTTGEQIMALGIEVN